MGVQRNWPLPASQHVNYFLLHPSQVCGEYERTWRPFSPTSAYGGRGTHCHLRALPLACGGRGQPCSQTACCEFSCWTSPPPSFSFFGGGTEWAVCFQTRGRGSPLWLALGQGNSGQAWRLAFLEPPPSGDYTVRVKPAPFGSCSPRGTFRAELSGQAVGCVGRLALPAPASAPGTASGTGGQPTSRVPSGGPC